MAEAKRDAKKTASERNEKRNSSTLYAARSASTGRFLTGQVVESRAVAFSVVGGAAKKSA